MEDLLPLGELVEYWDWNVWGGGTRDRGRTHVACAAAAVGNVCVLAGHDVGYVYVYVVVYCADGVMCRDPLAIHASSYNASSAWALHVGSSAAPKRVCRGESVED
jgi:hypothetical protein